MLFEMKLLIEGNEKIINQTIRRIEKNGRNN